MAMDVYLRVLGGLELVPTRLTRPKPLLLLAYLCLEGAKDRDHLCDLFYTGTANPRAGLRVALRHLRDEHRNIISTDRDSVGTSIAADALELLDAADRRADARVRELYHGPFLEGVRLDGFGVELEEWILGTRERLAQLGRTALLRQAHGLHATGEVAAATRLAERAYTLAATPPLAYDLLQPLYDLLAEGESPHALDVRRELEELGVELRTPVRSVPVLAASDDAGTQATEGSRPATPNNLTSAATSFVGRQRELDELSRHLHEPQRRLLTILGPGGIGKTRLALHLAHRQVESGSWDGVFMIQMGDVTEPKDLPFQIARALSHRLSGNGNPLDELLGVIGSRRLLLVLDGFDPWVSHAGALPALLDRCPNVRLIVTSRERLRLASESAYPLHGLPIVGDGHDTHASHDRLGPSIELFVHRARSADLHFRPTPDALEHVAHICRLVEGAPLAIELAAAWVRAVPIEDVADRIRESVDSLPSHHQDVPDRHRSLRAAFEYSWNLLEPRERGVFARLGIFRGGFRREDAAYVADASIPILASLIDKSLVRIADSGRYELHALLQWFATAKLSEMPGAGPEAAARHAHRYAEIAERMQRALRTSPRAQEVDRHEVEMGNFRAALEWSLEHADGHLALRLTGALGLYWYVRPAHAEGRRWLAAALDLPRPPQPAECARALHAAGRIARAQGDFDVARAWLSEGLRLDLRGDREHLAAECHNELGIVAAASAEYDTAIAHFEQALDMTDGGNGDDILAKILSNLGLLYTIVDRLDEAERLYRRSLATARARSNERDVAHTLSNLALVASRRGDHDKALVLYGESCRIARELRNRPILAEAILGQGTAKHLRGDPVGAYALVRESLELFREVHDRLGVIDALSEVASLAVAAGDARFAVCIWGATLPVRDRLGFPLQPYQRDRYERDVQTAANQLSGPEFAAAQADGEAWSIEDATAAALGWRRDE